MYPAFVAASAPVAYGGQQQNAGYAVPQSAVPAYGMVSYPATTGAPGYSGYAAAQGAPTYSGLDAAVYSAASAMLVERGVTPHQKTYSQNISGYPSTVPSQSQNSSWNRIEAMNPTTPVTSSSSSRGGRGGGRGGFSSRGGRGGSRGGYGGRYGNDKPKDPANQAVHYCEVCKVSCAGQVSFQAHIIGSKHKKREQQVKWEKDKAAAGSSTETPGVANRTTLFGPAQKCELCGISTAGPAAYDAHLKGKNHQRTLKLHMSLGKPIPLNEPTVNMRTVDTIHPRPGTSRPELTTGSSVCTKVVTGGKTVLITPKMNFVGGTVLHTTENGLQEDVKSEVGLAPTSVVPTETATGSGVEGQSPKKNGAFRRGPVVKHTVNPNSTAEPIGESYVQKTEKAGKVAYYKCTLCDCDFSDESGMNSHIRGRRHRLAYQKKVDPSIVVELPNSQKKAKALAEARANRGRGGSLANRGKRPAPGSPYGGPSAGPKRMAYGAPRPPLLGQWNAGPMYPPPPGPQYDPYGPAPPPYGTPGPYGGGLLAPPPQYTGPPQHFQPHPGPPPFHPPAPVEHLPFDQDESFDAEEATEDVPPPQPRPPVVKPAPRLDQQYLLMKHRQTVPSAVQVDSLQKTVTNVERALKSLTDKLMLPAELKPADAIPPADGAPDVVVLSKPSQKMLKGLFRFGALTKNLLTRSNMLSEILLISTRHPDAKDLDIVADALQAELKVICPLLAFVVVAHADQCGIFVKALEPELPAALDGGAAGSAPQPDPSYPVWVYLAYGALRDELFKATADNATAVVDGQTEKTVVGVSPGGSIGSVVAANTATVAGDPTSTAVSSAEAPRESGPKVSAVEAFSRGLDLARSLAVLAQSRRTRWFQEFITFFPQCRMLMRVLNQVCEQHVDLRPLVGWPIEFLTITTLRVQAAFYQVAPLDIPLPEAFWMILSKIAGGAFLPGCPNGFKDPCERGAIDVLGAATVEERVKVTKAVSDLVARWLTGDYAKVLGLTPLPDDPLYKMDVVTETTPVIIDSNGGTTTAALVEPQIPSSEIAPPANGL